MDYVLHANSYLPIPERRLWIPALVTCLFGMLRLDDRLDMHCLAQPTAAAHCTVATPTNCKYIVSKVTCITSLMHYFDFGCFIHLLELVGIIRFIDAALCDNPLHLLLRP